MTPFGNLWNRHSDTLLKTPRTFDADGLKLPGLKSFFYEGLSWRGNENRGFAFYGLPDGASAKNKVPAIVLIPGGKGEANPDWLPYWIKRGYAAITMDMAGCMPEYDGVKCVRPQVRHGWGGPDSADASFQQMIESSFHQLLIGNLKQGFTMTLSGLFCIGKNLGKVLHFPVTEI